MGKVLKNLLLLAASLMIAAIVGEYAVRFAFDDITSTSNMQTWFGARWQEQYVAKNSLGFREREPVMPKPAGVYRILMLGDSFGFGQGLPIQERFSSRLEQALNSQSGPHPVFEVINFSFPGATALDQMKVLSDSGLKLEPDFILVQWLPNDFEDQAARWKTKQNPLIPNDALHRKLQKTSALYFLLNNQWQQLKPYMGITQQSYEEELLAPFADPQSTKYSTAKQPMIDFLQLLNSSGIEYALILHPFLSLDLATDSYQMRPLHDLALSICEQAKATCLDVSQPFVELGRDYNMRKMWVNRFDPHPSGEANRMVTEYVLAKLAPQAWGYTPD